MTDEIWKPVPKELVNGIDGIFASNKGRVKKDDKVLVYSKLMKWKDVYYKSLRLNNKTTYVHRLVYFAFSDKPVNVLLNSRVIFKAFHPQMVDEQGYYRSYLEDLLFEQTKYDNLEAMIPSKQLYRTHPIYGGYLIGKWYDVQAHRFDKTKKEDSIVEYPDYQLCIIDDNQMPCIVKSKHQDKKFIKPIASKGDIDMMITLTKDKVHTKYLVSHVILPSVFDLAYVKTTVDHIDDNAQNNHIENLQWLTLSENAAKGRKKQLSGTQNSEPNTPQSAIDDEEWRKLNHFTEVSNYGRIRRNGKDYTLGCKLRGKKYRYCTCSLQIEGYPTNSKKYYIHQLVWIGFNGKYDETFHILHDDTIPLDSDGCYRNWLQDLSLGSRTQNNLEHHAQKRVNIAEGITQQLSNITL